MKVLILRFSSIGDIVLTSPIMRCLKKAYPNAQVHYATKKAFADIVAGNPYITRVHVLQHSLSALVQELKAEKFDLVIDLHHNLRTWLIKFQLGVKANSFNKLNIEKWLMVNFKFNCLPAIHIVDRYLAACKPLLVSNDGEGLDYFIKPADEVNLQTLPEGFQNGYIGWVIGAKQHTKQFPANKIIEALNAEGFPAMPVVLLGGEEDAETANYIMAGVAGKKIYNACGKYSLNQSAWLVKQARLIIANDTGLMHIAAAFKRPIVSIWGNTIPGFGMYQYYGHLPIANSLLQVNNLPCRPCSKLGYSQCPKGHFKCMNNIANAEVLAAVQKVLASA